MLRRWIVFSAVVVVTLSLAGMIAVAQQAGPFFDARRLPDLEAERRNQDVLLEQRRQQEADAKRKADEQRAAAEADAKRKADEQRVAAEADAKRKADEQRAAAEADAKRKADEQRIAAEADAKRKADEQRAAAEADAKRKADEQRLAAEADAKRKADEQRLAAEADAKRKADEQRIAAEAAARKTAALAPAPPTAALQAPAACTDVPKTSVTPLIGGRLQLTVESPCRRGQAVELVYGEETRPLSLDPGTGKVSAIVDLYLGDGQGVTLSTADGQQIGIATAIPTEARAYSKVALIWTKAVDLDLHAIENNAQLGAAGHVHAKAPRTAEEAQALAASSGRGAGFISSSSDGRAGGSHIEVYTFFHSPDQPAGAVPFAIEHATRGATATGEACGDGALAEVDYEAIITTTSGDVTRENGILPSVACGTPLDGRARYLREAVSDLRFKR